MGKTRRLLESVQFDLLLVDAALGGQKGQDLSTLIALELNNGTQLFILYQGAVASEVLLEDLEHALLVKVGRQSLDGGQGLASVTLLDTNICMVKATRKEKAFICESSMNTLLSKRLQEERGQSRRGGEKERGQGQRSTSGHSCGLP